LTQGRSLEGAGEAWPDERLPRQSARYLPAQPLTPPALLHDINHKRSTRARWTRSPCSRAAGHLSIKFARPPRPATEAAIAAVKLRGPTVRFLLGRFDYKQFRSTGNDDTGVACGCTVLLTTEDHIFV